VSGSFHSGGSSLANIASSKKDARRSARRAMRNRSIRSAVKTKVNKFRRGIAAGTADVETLAVAAISALDRGVSKGVLHRNNAARRKSRLMRRLKATAGTRSADS
jgi:small subunit ribosomal protein S20